jgi:hypothetical protein
MPTLAVFTRPCEALNKYDITKVGRTRATTGGATCIEYNQQNCQEDTVLLLIIGLPGATSLGARVKSLIVVSILWVDLEVTHHKKHLTKLK